MKYVRLLFIYLSLAFVSADLYAGDSTGVYRVIKSSTGQSYLFAQTTTGGILRLDVYFRMGTIYEIDSGERDIYAVKIAQGHRQAYHQSYQGVQANL
jgi:hypothetical protein